MVGWHVPAHSTPGSEGSTRLLVSYDDALCYIKAVAPEGARPGADTVSLALVGSAVKQSREPEAVTVLRYSSASSGGGLWVGNKEGLLLV